MEDIFGAAPVAPSPSPVSSSYTDIFGATPNAARAEEAVPEHLFHEQAASDPGSRRDTRAAAPPTEDTAYHVRKRSGRVSGPFPTSKILEMFARGELLGSEDASADGVSWRSMTQIPAFAAAIQEAMNKAMTGLEDLPVPKPPEPHSAPSNAAVLDIPPDASAPAATLGDATIDTAALRDAERSKRIVERKRQQRARQLIRFAAVAGVLLVIVVAGVVVNVATPYGYFGINLLLGSDQDADVAKTPIEQPPPPLPDAPTEDPASLLARDTYLAYRQGAEQTERIVAAAKDLTPFPESAKKAAAQRARFLGYLVVVERMPVFQPKIGEALVFADGDEVAKAVGEAAAAYGEQQWDKGMAVVKPLTEQSRTLPPEAKSEAWTWLCIGQRGKKDHAGAAVSCDNALQANAHNKLAMYLQGATLSETGDTEGAGEYLKKVLNEDPSHPRATILLGNLLVARPETREEGAKLFFDVAEGKIGELASPVQKAEAFLGRANVAIAARQFPLALKLASQAPELVPQHRDIRLQSAWIALRLRDFGAAKEHGKKLRELNADDLEATFVIARADMGNRDTLTAYTALQTAAKKHREHAMLHFWFGVAARELSKLDEARKMFEKAASLDPSKADPIVELLYDAIDQGKLKDALTRATGAEAAIDARERFKVLAAKAVVHTRRRAFADAEKEFKAAIETQPADADTRARYVGMLIAAKRIADAERELEEARAADEKHPMVLMAEGDLLLAKHDAKGALGKLEEAMQTAPNLFQPYVRAARVAAELKDYGRAKGFVDTAGQLRPGIAEVIAAQAAVTRSFDANGAARLLKQASELSPEEPLYQYELGLTFANMGALLEAIDTFKHVVELDPDHADALFHLGKVYRDMGRASDADKALNRSLALEPKRVEGWLELAELATVRGDELGTVKAYERALEADPENGTSVCAMGEVLILRLGSEAKFLKRGIDIMERCVRLLPAHATAWVTLGNAYKTVGRRADAIRAFKQHLQVNPAESAESGIARDQLSDLGAR